MVNSVNFAITIFNYLDDARLVQGATFPCGQRILCIKAISATEDPSGFFSRKHKYIWIQSSRATYPAQGYPLSFNVLVQHLCSVFGDDLNIPYCKKVEKVHAYHNYINKSSASSLSTTDQIVISAIRLNSRLGNTDLLATLVPELGINKASLIRRR